MPDPWEITDKFPECNFDTSRDIDLYLPFYESEFGVVHSQIAPKKEAFFGR